MFRCNNCNADFEQYDVIREDSGEKWYVCPCCRGIDFDEVKVRSEDDKYLFIKKDDVIDFVVSAIAFINKGDIDAAKETLVELILDMVDSDFDYKSALETVMDNPEDLVAQIQNLLEVVKV